MNDIELFLRTSDRLTRLIGSTDPMDSMELASKLYILLLDKTPLIHRVNDKRKKIVFRVRVLERPPIDTKLQFHSLFAGMSEKLFPKVRAQIEEIGLSKFQNFKIAEFEGEAISVKTAIKYARNSAGGSHYDPESQRDQNQIIRILEQSFPLKGTYPGLRLMKGISAVTLDALEPLVRPYLRS